MDILNHKSAASRMKPADLDSTTGQNQPQLIVRYRMESAVARIQQPVLELAAGQSQPKSYPAAGAQKYCRIETAITRIQPLELESALQQNQPQLLCSHQKLSQPQDKIGCNSYPAAGTRASCMIESTAATCIQPLELESVIRQNQLEM